jgi:GNAT superfamily N-acetyltransferase
VSVKFASSVTEIAKCFPIAVQLRSHLTESEFVSQVQRQQQAGYSLVYLELNAVRAIAGFRILETLAHGKLLYVDDLVTDASARSQGYGSILYDWLVEYAKSQGCASVQLDSGTQRLLAHRFYFKQRMTISSFHFILKLDLTN